MYILKCSDDSYYVGSTKDLEYRFSPVELVYSEEYEKVVDAYIREKQVQGWSRAKREALINSKQELLPKLAKKNFKKNRWSSSQMLIETNNQE